MSGQSSIVPKLFEQRMEVIRELSQETAGHLRILQRHSGQRVLSMKDPDAAETIAAQEDTEAQLEACQQRIHTLELELNRIDTEIAAATNKEQEDG